MTPLIIAGGATLSVIGAIGAYLDLRFRRLPNWLSGLALVSGLGFSLLAGGWAMAGWALLHALAALVVGAGLFALGGFGGGDAKYYAGLAAWFPFKAGLGLLLCVSLTGLVLLIVWLPFRKRLRPDLPKDSDFRKVPYGVAIAGGAMVQFVMRNLSLW